MLRDTLVHSLANAGALAVVAVCNVLMAAQMGPVEFGRWAGFQAAYSMLLPLVALRIDTRVAAAESAVELQRVVSATLTGALLFAAAGLVAAVVLSGWLAPLLVLLAFALAALTCIADVLIAAYAFRGQRSRVVVLRSARLILPAGGALVAIARAPDLTAAAAGTLVGMALCLPWCLWPMRAELSISWRVLVATLQRYASGLSASLSLGLLNSVWLQGLVPTMNLLGLSQVAGQYALVQRLLGAPLGIFGMALNTVLLRKGDALHLSPRRMVRLAIGLFSIAGALAMAIAWGLWGQRLQQVPAHWLLPPALFVAAAFFQASSFAVGGISIVCVRLKDEWFVAAWQLAALAVWAAVLASLTSSTAFQAMLWAGGVAYWVLLARWCRVSAEGHAHDD